MAPRARTAKPVDDELDGIEQHARWAADTWAHVDEEVETLVSRIDKAQRLITQAERASLKRVGLAPEEFKVLIRLHRGPRAHGALCEELMVSTGSMTNRLDKLERSGFLRRQRDPEDRRGVLLELTPAGRTKLDEYIAIQGRREIELLDVLDPEEKRELNRILRKFLHSLQPSS